LKFFFYYKIIKKLIKKINLFLVPQVTEALNATITPITQTPFNRMSSRCLFRKRREVIDNAGTVNPHIIVETIAWNVLMADTIAVKIV
jgi:hypothetical protein